jgi:hypothetical protein
MFKPNPDAALPQRKCEASVEEEGWPVSPPTWRCIVNLHVARLPGSACPHQPRLSCDGSERLARTGPGHGVRGIAHAGRDGARRHRRGRSAWTPSSGAHAGFAGVALATRANRDNPSSLRSGLKSSGHCDVADRAILADRPIERSYSRGAAWRLCRGSADPRS